MAEGYHSSVTLFYLFVSVLFNVALVVSLNHERERKMNEQLEA